MGGNPSTFKTPDRPVENVDWEDSQKFITAINRRLPGLNLSLPSEARWEYACRAGTETALYAGPIEILGENNAPALELIAWYGGNSGQGFELDNGWDSSDWQDKQYPEDTRAGTHPVAQKLANAWGLYDMLGNVWEWTADAWQDDYEGAPVDGSARLGPAGAGRVVRGGSWLYDARNLRAAVRIGRLPGNRFDYQGLRCARVQRS
jgi:formylglycine-generating enzyme required for sulfatase activity